MARQQLRVLDDRADALDGGAYRIEIAVDLSALSQPSAAITGAVDFAPSLERVRAVGELVEVESEVDPKLAFGERAEDVIARVAQLPEGAPPPSQGNPVA